jgi:hypothetical protein
MYLAKLFTNLVRMDLECEHGSICGKKISSFARAVKKIFNFFFSVNRLLGHPVYVRLRLCDLGLECSMDAQLAFEAGFERRVCSRLRIGFVDVRIDFEFFSLELALRGMSAMKS